MVGNISGRMAIHAASHIRRHFFDEHLTLINRAVTGPAHDTAFCMAGMAEKDKIRDFVNAHPLDLAAGLLHRRQPLDRWAIRLDPLMTEHALRDIRQAGPFFPFRSGMAIQTGDARACMLRMAEGDRLRRHLLGQVFFLPLVGAWNLRKRDMRKQIKQNH